MLYLRLTTYVLARVEAMCCDPTAQRLVFYIRHLSSQLGFFLTEL
jgi:hypothetical protein